MLANDPVKITSEGISKISPDPIFPVGFSFLNAFPFIGKLSARITDIGTAGSLGPILRLKTGCGHLSLCHYLICNDTAGGEGGKDGGKVEGWEAHGICFTCLNETVTVQTD
ncbi:hypothetical protein E2C01_005154 [Portunus trituberculatus]|uniref:Uncharacterized protein n=1 Tax=Portunus trituberculatus TaxID=210409 RepID=A0A5B7CVV6_PORTR|nr:hypothetical protein [Portunus trituberculatus]